MRFVHTSDWHIGKTFRFADEASQVLRDERLDAINRLGELALGQCAPDVLVAGDIYDVETPSERTLLQPIERMRAFEKVQWHLIPGNHDSHSPRGPWERLQRRAQQVGLPANIVLHLKPEPTPIAGGTAMLLPSVLSRRQAIDDPTAWMDDAATPEGLTRIGLAHGSIRSFGSDADLTPNQISTDRAASAGLAYLALGDWHGANAVSERCRYSGTPEIDDFSIGGEGGGNALVVEVESPRSMPSVTTHRIGRFIWHKRDIALHDNNDIELLDSRLRELAADLWTVLVWLRVTGVLSLEARDLFERRIRQGVGNALRVLRVDDSGVLPSPTPADLAAIDHAGFVRAAADKLTMRASDEADPQRDLAAAALQRLYLLSMQTSSVS
jgi:DNA repair exonuclease SbcCD nuclease subunit